MALEELHGVAFYRCDAISYSYFVSTKVYKEMISRLKNEILGTKTTKTSINNYFRFPSPFDNPDKVDSLQDMEREGGDHMALADSVEKISSVSRPVGRLTLCGQFLLRGDNYTREHISKILFSMFQATLAKNFIVQKGKDGGKAGMLVLFAALAAI
ncbi:hypothetical protein U1Q18_034759 [Sarracenia purpurea var. burkii]